MYIKEKLEITWKECKRVLKVSRKPDADEYFQFAKITALGMIVIGVIGFVIVLISQLIGL
ncbi:protein translocase SEC61 complex subunit gamma [uncultured Methanobrevibacter sp.]|uniref:protein translocase SEC61 complex subunit gamma n=1 Tax=uncultured Methanobrevibacter sp. TaxID=253161 RepID=UPI0015BC39C5|nr:protein translocase SEC61 complex subunit gamma [uncultured Methanobrevibacter sp.]